MGRERGRDGGWQSGSGCLYNAASSKEGREPLKLCVCISSLLNGVGVESRDKDQDGGRWLMGPEQGVS